MTRAAKHHDNARAAWGDALPLWVAALAEACDKASLGKVAERVKYSAAALSQVINGKYPGDLVKLERAVRGALLAEVVACPVLARTIPTSDCGANQRRGFSTASPLAARLGRTCPTCPQREGAGEVGEGGDHG